jgi:hypothetical protein
MTAELLRHLAELNQEAAQFTTNPVWARSYAHAARTARLEAARLAREEAKASLRTQLSDIKAQLTAS